MRDDKGRFAEGNTGRPKGSVGKSNNKIRETFQLLLENNIEKIQEDLNELEPKDRIKLLLNLSNYILPKLRSIDLQSDIEETITIDFNESIGWNKTEDQEEN
jgi:uncharacterized protein YeeX (DUF496 family)